MRFERADIEGAFLLHLDRHEDERGSFARTFDAAEFAAHGLETSFRQLSLSSNSRRGTLRGMHFQLPPHEEVKIVRCVRGAVYDVMVDLRASSTSYRRSAGYELSAENGTAVYIPKGCAHGFQTLEDESEVLYQIAGDYSPEHARGVRFDDPALAIEWPPEAERTVSERDRTWPDLQAES